MNRHTSPDNLALQAAEQAPPPTAEPAQAAGSERRTEREMLTPFCAPDADASELAVAFTVRASAPATTFYPCRPLAEHLINHPRTRAIRNRWRERPRLKDGT